MFILFLREKETAEWNAFFFESPPSLSFENFVSLLYAFSYISFYTHGVVGLNNLVVFI